MAPPWPEAVYLFDILNEDERLDLKYCTQAFTGRAEENSQPTSNLLPKETCIPTARPAFPEGWEQPWLPSEGQRFLCNTSFLLLLPDMAFPGSLMGEGGAKKPPGRPVQPGQLQCLFSPS